MANLQVLSWLRYMAMFVAIIGLLCAPTGASAHMIGAAKKDDKAAATVPADASPEVTRDLVSRLSDEQVRQLLLQRLDAQAKQEEMAGPQGGGVVQFFADAGSALTSSAYKAVISLPRLGVEQAKVFHRFYDKRGAGGTLAFFGFLILALAVGGAAYFLVGFLTRGTRLSDLVVGEEAGLKAHLKVLSRRLLVDAGGLVAFVLVCLPILKVTMSAEDFHIARYAVLAFLVWPLVMRATSRFLIAPNRPDLRLVHTDNASAIFLHRHQALMVLLIGAGFWLLGFDRHHGLPIGELQLGFWFNLAILSYLAIVAYRCRHGLQMMMRGRDQTLTRTEARVAQAYPYVIMVGCLFIWILVEYLVAQNRVELLQYGQPYLTLIIILMAPAMDTMIRGLVPHLVPPMKGEGLIAEEAHRLTHRSFVRIGRVLIFGCVVLLIANMWHIDLVNLASAGFGARAAGRLLGLSLILGTGFLIFEFATLWINRRLADEQTALGIDLTEDEPGGGEGGGVGGSRQSTVLPLLRWMVQSAIIVITLLLALGHIGLDITPLLAGAGIVGLAVGFGAQKLVADVVSGIFFLIDDAFRTGEYLEIDGTFGTVEKISIRSIQLRHHRGPVHTIPFGEIPKITNYSRDWVIMKMRFTVPFDTDLNKVKKIFKKIGADIMEVPEFAEDLLQTFKSQGVLEVDDVGIVVRGKFMSKPGKQFTLRKEIYQRVQREFEANGLEFARREVRVRLEGDDERGLTEEDKEAIAAAAVEAARSDEQSGAKAADGPGN